MTAEINATIWFLTKDEQYIPIETNEKVNKTKPRQLPIVEEWSMLPISSPRKTIDIQYMNVGISVNKDKIQPEMYFEITICNVVMGFVFKSSKVPVRYSSANNLMVKLGISYLKIGQKEFMVF